MKQLINDITAQLLPCYPADEARSLAWWIVEEETGLSRSQLLSGYKGTTNFSKLQDFCDKNDLCSHKNPFITQKDCSSQENANVTSGEDDNQAESEDTIQAIIERLLHFEPIQYIFGHTLWNGLDLLVTPATLIPRPETAELVERISNQFKQHQTTSNFHVLDVGTGSGCIAIALKKAHPEWQVTGIDISAEAIEVAKENAKRNGVEVEFEVADIFNLQLIENRKSKITNRKFDIVVSNPPYICESEKISMNPNVLDYEPASALFVPDSDPIRFYRRIAELFTNRKSKIENPLYLFFEINEHFSDEIETLLQSLGYHSIRIHRDIYGKPRIAEGVLLSDV